MVNSIGPSPLAKAQDFALPAPGTMVSLSPAFAPPVLKGIKVHPDNPFRFEFILDRGDSHLGKNQLKNESTKLIKYFLASLTIPEKDLWVNLSPYEKDRIVPELFGQTEMGRDLLAEDYMLKQITASLIYPEGETGKKFWQRIYAQAAKRFGTTNIPVNTFNKVWIVPEKAVVYENAKAGTAYVVESRLKVMLEEDYLSLQKHEGIQFEQSKIKDTNQLGSQVVREIVIPELSKEVNEDKNFAQLRQVYNSLILATWYKKKIKDSILAQVYENKNKVAGVDINDPKEKQRIYERYLQAFKKGVYNYIKEEIDPVTQERTQRKYFSGGEKLINVAEATLYTSRLPSDLVSDKAILSVDIEGADQAMQLSGGQKVKGRPESEKVKALRAWADEHRGQKVPETREGLSKQFGLSLAYVGKILSFDYDITTAWYKEEEVKALRAWADEHRGQKVLQTQASLGKQFGLSQAYVGKILSKYDITTAGSDHEKKHNKISILLEGLDMVLLKSIRSELQKRGYNVIEIVKGLKEIEIGLRNNPDINFVISEGEIDPGKIGNRRFINLGNYLNEDEELKEKRAEFFDEIERLSRRDYAQAANGGIDLTPANINLQTQSRNGDIIFHINPAMLAKFQNTPGFIPVIIDYEPLISLKEFLEQTA